MDDARAVGLSPVKGGIFSSYGTATFPVRWFYRDAARDRPAGPTNLDAQPGLPPERQRARRTEGTGRTCGHSSATNAWLSNARFLQFQVERMNRTSDDVRARGARQKANISRPARRDAGGTLRSPHLYELERVEVEPHFAGDGAQLAEQFHFDGLLVFIGQRVLQLLPRRVTDQFVGPGRG